MWYCVVLDLLGREKESGERGGGERGGGGLAIINPLLPGRFGWSRCRTGERTRTEGGRRWEGGEKVLVVKQVNRCQYVYEKVSQLVNHQSLSVSE